MRVAAIVVRWRGGDEVARCLGSLAEHGGDRLTSVILVDSGSGDGGGEALARRFTDVELVALEHNRSFAVACHRGVEACNEPLLLLLNPDAELTPGALDVLVGFAARRPEVAGAVPLLVGPDGRSQHRWQLRRLPSWRRLAVGLGGAAAFSPSPPAGPAPVAQPAAAAWLVRRSAWQALDGFDPIFAPAWWEDVDFCTRLAGRLSDPAFPVREGFWVAPRSLFRHLGGVSAGQMAAGDFLDAYYGNLLRYAERHHAARLGIIRAGLKLSLLARAAARPSMRAAYRHAMPSLGHSLRE